MNSAASVATGENLIQAKQLKLWWQTLFALLLKGLLVGRRVLSLLRVSDFQSKGLRCSFIAATFRVQSECSHLVLDLAKDLVWCSWSLHSNILHTLKLLCQILLDSLDEKMQVSDTAAGLLVATGSCSANINATLGVTASSLLQLFALLSHAFFQRFLLALVVGR